MIFLKTHLGMDSGWWFASQAGKRRMGSFPKMGMTRSKKRSKAGPSPLIDFYCFLDESL